LPAWRKRGSGVIVNVSSVNGPATAPYLQPAKHQIAGCL
jgi:NAD(P)-dependent dehydrogenase (short-subunit alcohol dehydrogenase family)